MNKVLNMILAMIVGLGILPLLSVAVYADVEPNNNLNSAENVNYGTISGNIDSSTDPDDYYKFGSITKDSVVFVNLTTAPIGTTITLYDGESGDYIASKTGVGSKFIYCPNDASDQSLIVQISDATGAYTFTAEKMLQNDAGTGSDAPAQRTVPLPVISPGTYTGYMADYDTDDYYEVDLPAGRYIYIDLYPSSTITPYLELYDTNYYVRGVTGSQYGEHLSIWYYSDVSERYKIGISASWENYGTYTLIISTAEPNDGGQGIEAGKVSGSEIYLNGSVNGTYPGTFAGKDEEDWYLVNLTDGDAITVNAKPTSTESISVELYRIETTSEYDKSGTSITNGANVTLHSCYNTAGGPLQVQLRVEDWVEYGKRNDYNITLQIIHQNDGNSGKDAGETTGTAVEITKGNYSGYIEDEDEIDYYKFNVNAGNTINITFTAPTNMKVTATLYDALNTQRGTFSITSGGTRTLTYLNAASAQTYYLKIEHDSYGSDPKPTSYFYDFKLDLIGGDTDAPSAYMVPLPSTSCTNFTVSWGSPDSDAVIYTVQVRYGTNDWMDWKVNVTIKSAVYPGINNTRFFFRVKACDLAGNWGTYTSNPEGDTSTNVTCEGTSSADTTNPTITITSPSNGASIPTGETNIIGTATDNVGVINVEVRLGNGVWRSATRNGNNWNITVVISEGSNTITARATDASGNSAEVSITVTGTVGGNTAPASVTLNTPTKITKNGFTLTWTQNTESAFYSYEVHISTTSNFSPNQTTKKTEILYAETITCTLTNLKSNTLYYAKIKVTDKGGLSSISNEVSAKTLSSSSNNNLCCSTMLILSGIIPCALLILWRRKN